MLKRNKDVKFTSSEKELNLIFVYGKKAVKKRVSLTKAKWITFDKIKYFINHDKIVYIDGEPYLFYKKGLSEPVDFNLKSEEYIFSKELTNSFMESVISKFKADNTKEVIDSISFRVNILMLLIALCFIVIWIKSKKYDEILNAINNLKSSIIVVE